MPYRIVALSHRNHPERPARGAKLVHVPLGRERMRAQPPGQAKTLLKVLVAHAHATVTLGRPARASIFPVDAQHGAADIGCNQHRRLF